MSKEYSSDHYLVVDNFLSDAEFTLVSSPLLKMPLTRPAVEAMDSVWPVGGVLPYCADGLRAERVEGERDVARTALRLFSSRLDALLPRLTHLIGEKGSDWRDYTLTLFAYPQLAELNWHSDDERRMGAFTYYIHPEWNGRWGGELLIRDRGSPVSEGGVFLQPTPNRLVVIKGGIDHKVAPISSEAGRRLRTAVTGFFNRL